MGDLGEELAAELGTALASRVDESARELAALAARDEAGIERLLARLDDPPAIVVPELADDVHDIAGLSLVRDYLFPDVEGAGAFRPARAPRSMIPSATRRSAGSRWPQSTSRRIARRFAPTPEIRSSTSGSGRTKPATAARSSEIALRSRRSASPRSSGSAQIAAIRSGSLS